MREFAPRRSLLRGICMQDNRDLSDSKDMLSYPYYTRKTGRVATGGKWALINGLGVNNGVKFTGTADIKG